MTAARVARALGWVVAVVVLFAACGIPTDDHARPLAEDEIPSPLAAPPVTPGAGGQVPGEVFFVQGSRVRAVPREIPVPAVEGTIAVLLAGPSTGERSGGLRTALSGKVRLAGTLAVGVPVVEVAGALDEIELEEQILALAQLVYSLTGLPGVEGVSFSHSGRVVEVPTGDGTLKRGPLGREDYAGLAPVG